MIGQRQEKLLELLARGKSELEKYRQSTGGIDGLIELVRRQPASAELVWLAFDAGWKVGAAKTVRQNEQPLLAGIASRKGSLLGGARTHSAAETRHKAMRERYDYHAAKLSDVTKESRKVLCGIVAEEFGVTPETIADRVPNPTPTRRGRPRKHIK